MANLKVKPLEWYMMGDQEELFLEGYVPVPDTFELVGRDGYYCYLDFVWFEYQGVGYFAFPGFTSQKAREHFCYTITVNDEAILLQKEAEAMQTVLKTTRDSAVKKAIRQRLQLHRTALELRECRRDAAKPRPSWSSNKVEY